MYRCAAQAFIPIKSQIPLLFYTNVCGNVEKEYTRDELDSQLKAEFVSALQPAFGRLSDLELRPNQIVTHNTDLENAMNTALSEKWGQLRGLKVVSIALGSVTLPDEDAEMIKQAQRTAIMRDPDYGGGHARGCAGGCHEGGGSQRSRRYDRLYGHGYGHECRRRYECTEPVCHGPAATAAAQQQAPAAPGSPGGGRLEMRLRGYGQRQFLPELRRERSRSRSRRQVPGSVSAALRPRENSAPSAAPLSRRTPRAGPAPAVRSTRANSVRTAGRKSPKERRYYRCDKCGWEPEDPTNPPKFCPECGDIFDDNDKK